MLKPNSNIISIIIWLSRSNEMLYHRLFVYDIIQSTNLRMSEFLCQGLSVQIITIDRNVLIQFTSLHWFIVTAAKGKYFGWKYFHIIISKRLSGIIGELGLILIVDC